MNIDAIYILFSMLYDGYNVYKTVTIIENLLHQIFLTKTMIIIIHTFVVYFVENENICLNETQTDCKYETFCDARFAIENLTLIINMKLRNITVRVVLIIMVFIIRGIKTMQIMKL